MPTDVALASQRSESLLPAGRVRIADLVTLTKPRITTMVLITTAGGMWLAPAALTATRILLTLLGTWMVVAGANTLNMFIERELDGKMKRTERRPLPAGRMSPRVALAFGVALSACSLPILALGVNLTTALLALLANVSYVLAYTPMKQRSHWALLVGAIPGAIPPLLGWTAATATVDAGGLALFAILFFWQVPHFHAIALFRKEDYARAGLHVMPNVLGDEATKRSIVSYTAALIASTLLIYPLGIAGRTYLVAAFLLGCTFLAWGTLGLDPKRGARWAKGLFAYSIVYLVLLFSTLVADRVA